MRMAKFLALSMVLVPFIAIVSGCGSLRPNMIPPKVEMKQIQVQDLSFKEMKLLLHLDIENKNSYAIRVDKMDYKFFLLKDGNRDLLISGELGVGSSGAVGVAGSVGNSAGATGSAGEARSAELQWDGQKPIEWPLQLNSGMNKVVWSLRLPMDKIISSAIQLLTLGEIQYEIEANVKSGLFTVPFHQKGSFKPKKD